MTPAVSHNPDMSHVRDRSAVRDALVHQSQHDEQLLRGLIADGRGLAAELMGFRPVKGCPHARLGPLEPWPELGLVNQTCRDCGATITVEVTG
jgi:hypothetical protein